MCDSTHFLPYLLLLPLLLLPLLLLPDLSQTLLLALQLRFQVALVRHGVPAVASKAQKYDGMWDFVFKSGRCRSTAERHQSDAMLWFYFHTTGVFSDACRGTLKGSF